MYDYIKDRISILYTPSGKTFFEFLGEQKKIRSCIENAIDKSFITQDEYDYLIQEIR